MRRFFYRLCVRERHAWRQAMAAPETEEDLWWWAIK